MYCSTCGCNFESAARFCSQCGGVRTTAWESQAAGNQAAGNQSAPRGGFTPVTAQLLRPHSPRMIAGVCSAFAEHYGWDLALVRVLTVAITVFTGVMVFVYLAAWIVIPEVPYVLVTSTPPPPPPAQGTESAAF